MRDVVQRYLRIAFFVLGASIVSGLATGNNEASALSGTGYFTGQTTCTVSVGVRDCPDNSPPFSNDVVPGRPGTTPAVPNFGNDKIAYADWVVGQWKAGGTRREGARFIIGTMMGDKNAADDTDAFRQRFDNPDITMTRLWADPSTYGSISFRGKTGGGATDFFWTTAYGGTTGYMYIFRNNGNLSYVLEQNCGNPVGLPNYPGLPEYEPEDWSLSARSGIRGPAAAGAYSFNGATLNKGKVGETYYWAHRLRNEGPTDMTNTTAEYLVRRTVTDASGKLIVGHAFNNDYSTKYDPYDASDSVGAGENLYDENGDGKFWSGDKLRYTVKPEDGGRKICQWMAAFPRGNADISWLEAKPACVYIPFDYTLTPSISVDQSIVESPETKFNVIGTVTSTSGTWSAPDTQWQLVRIKYAPGVTDPSISYTGGTANQKPCAYYAPSGYGAAANCNAEWQKGTGQVPNNAGVTLTQDDTFTDFKVGERLCYAMAVTRPTQDPNPQWAYSKLQCVVVAKRPRVQIWGADARVGNNYFGPAVTNGNNDASIMTGFTRYASGIKGSWGEYGLLAPTSGLIASASGGALSGKTGAGIGLLSADMNKLSFANTISGNYGHFAPATSTSSILVGGLMGSGYGTAVANASGAIDLGSLSSSDLAHPKTVVIDAKNPSTSVKGTIPAGLTTVIIRATGSGQTVRISGDVLNGDRQISRASEVPQIIIVANDIIVANSVSRVDAWLIARPVVAGGSVKGGRVSTCDAFSEPYYKGLYAGSDCDKTPLIVNGPIIARELQLRRTNGEDPKGDALNSSEVINFRPDAYLWASTQASLSNRMDTVMTTELPPRF